VEAGGWLGTVLEAAEEEARRRGDRVVEPDHVGLALTRAEVARELLAGVGIDPLDWRDQIVRVLGWREGALAEREGRPAGNGADGPAELRVSGPVDLDPGVPHVLQLARDEAAASGGAVGPAQMLVGLLLEGESVAAATGRWLGMTPGRVRHAAGLGNVRRVVAAGIPHHPWPRSTGCGPIVLCGGGSDDALLAEVAAVVRRHSGRSTPSVLIVDAGWQTRRPTEPQRRSVVERWQGVGVAAVDAGAFDRDDAPSPEICERLAAAELVWFNGGDAAAIYDRLWATPALDAIRAAHDGGAAVGGISAGAMVWGAGTLSDFASVGDPEPFPLFGWLDDLVVFPHYLPPREHAFRERVAAFPGCQGLGVAHGGAVVVAAGSDGIRILHAAPDLPHVWLSPADGAVTTLTS
jgi:hypothetical protein